MMKPILFHLGPYFAVIFGHWVLACFAGFLASFLLFVDDEIAWLGPFYGILGAYLAACLIVNKISKATRFGLELALFAGESHSGSKYRKLPSEPFFEVRYGRKLVERGRITPEILCLRQSFIHYGHNPKPVPASVDLVLFCEHEDELPSGAKRTNGFCRSSGTSPAFYIVEREKWSSGKERMRSRVAALEQFFKWPTGTIRTLEAK